jgi:hypothetical protein
MLATWLPFRCDQLIPVNKPVDEKEYSEKGLRRRRRRRKKEIPS